MDGSPLDFWAVALGRRIVDDRQQPIGQRQDSQQQQKKLPSDRFGLASEAGEKVEIVHVIVADVGGREANW